MYLVVENFRSGLDSRRSILNAVPGSLTTLENAHITQGGEGEKRKAFVGISGLKSTSQLPSGCFGIQSTSSGLYTFGSISTPAGIPSGITYQRLQHPNGSTAMSAVVHSTAFAGLPWVIALFADGNTYVYYNGTIIYDFIDGLVLASQAGNNVSLAAALTAAINRVTNYTAVQQANPNDNKLNVFSSPGNLYASDATDTSASGTLSAVEQNQGTPSVSGQKATAQFQIVMGTENVRATRTLTNDGSNITDGDTVTIGSTVYRFKDTMTQAYDVKRGASNTASMTNLYLAINATGTAGTNYFAGTLAHPSVTATNPTGTTVIAQAITGGTAGNSIATTEASTHLAWGGATLTGGTDVNKISSVQVNGVELISAAVNWRTTNDATAIAMVTAINNNSATSGYSANSVQNIIYLTATTASSTPNNYTVQVTAAGNVCISNCLFTLTQNATGTDAWTVSAVNVDGTQIMNGSLSNLSVYGSLSGLATALAANINAFSATSGYLACAVSNIVYLSRLVTTSTDPTRTVNVTVGSGGGVGGIGSAGMTGTPSPVSSVSWKGSQGGSSDSSLSIKINVSGGVPPYTYAWDDNDAAHPGSNTSISVNSKNSSTTTFHCSKTVYDGGQNPDFFITGGVHVRSLTRYFVCKVTDSKGESCTSAEVVATCIA